MKSDIYKIGIIDTMNSKGIELLKSHKNFNVDVITDLSKENLLKVLPKYDGVTLRRGKLDSELLKKCKNLNVSVCQLDKLLVTCFTLAIFIHFFSVFESPVKMLSNN